MSAGAVLVSGAGVAGPALAYWLARSGFSPTIVEHAPAPRTGGYVIDFWGLGYDIAEAMGLSADLERLGYEIRELRIVGRDGRRRTGFGTGVFAEMSGGRFVTIRRSDLSRLLLERARPTTEILFGDTVESLRDDGAGVDVTFARGVPRRFDLVIGADGLHSAVGRIAFGPRTQFEASLGYTVAAFEATGYRPRDEDAYLMHNDPGLMLGRVSLRDDRTIFLFVFADPPSGQEPPRDLVSQKALLRQRYGGCGWETPHILDALDDADDLYFDRVSQIRMPRWSKGRIALIGDAAFCVSLMAGQGSALALTAAYVLAGELGRATATPGLSHVQAFDRYERLLRPYIASKQSVAKSMSAGFAPKTSLGLTLRNLVVSAAAIPGVARYTFARDLADKLALPDYGWRPASPDDAQSTRMR